MDVFMCFDDRCDDDDDDPCSANMPHAFSEFVRGPRGLTKKS